MAHHPCSNGGMSRGRAKDFYPVLTPLKQKAAGLGGAFQLHALAGRESEVATSEAPDPLSSGGLSLAIRVLLLEFKSSFDW